MILKNFNKHEYDDIGRIYVFNDLSQYYSVTTALGNTADKSFLSAWKERIGHKRADFLTKFAGEVGTAMHDCLETYLLGEQVSFPNSVVKNLANQIIPFIDKRVTDVQYTEKVLYSDRLKLAGTVDAVVCYAGVWSILDFKNAKKQPKIEWIQDYLLQLAIYAMMIEEMYGESINRGVLLFAYREKRSPHREVVVNLEKYKEKAKKRIEEFHKKVNS